MRNRNVAQPLPLSLCCRALLWVMLATGASAQAHASLTVFVAEPYGNFGTMMPVGHTAIFLDRVCADGPLKLRQCRAGEPAGVVIARYHAIGPYDWMATPVLQFLYAADTPDEIPSYVTRESAWEMRQSYRRRFLVSIVPDGTEKDSPVSEWSETVGAAYDRRIWGYRVDTTEEDDFRFIEWMNADRNRHLYRLKGTNCADFAAEAVNFYFPGAVPSPDRVADFGVMSPKQVARSMEAYGFRNPGAHLQVIEIPQVPGTLRRSRPVRGGAEGVLKTKRYLATLLVIQPELPLVLTCLYLQHGRWTIGRGAQIESPYDIAGRETSGGNIVAAR